MTNNIWKFANACASKLLHNPALTTSVAVKYVVHGHCKTKGQLSSLSFFAGADLEIQRHKGK